MVDFFERQERARKKTGQLIFLFVLSIIAIILAIYIGVSAVLGLEDFFIFYFDLSLFVTIAIGVLFIVLSGSLWRIVSLSKNGGQRVAEMLGGRLIDLNTTDLSERRLINVVEEMAIASGIPVPSIYILEKETGINAFAAGHRIQGAVVGVTKGCVQKLTRDELQGVIGHEFSHILNGDMRLNIRLMSFLHGILLIALIGYQLMRVKSTSSSNRKGGNPLPLLGLVLFLVGYIGVFFAKLIKAAVSRQREFLADASAVQFTRNPSGLAAALKKIGGSFSQLQTSKAEEASHFFFSLGVKQWITWLSTHPPLEERIRTLDPTWDGHWIKSYLDNDEFLSSIPSSIPKPAALNAQALISSTGAAQQPHFKYAKAFYQNIAPIVKNLLHESSGACAVIFSLLLSREAECRSKQIQIITETANLAISKELTQLMPWALQLEITAKLPFIQLTFPALKLLSAEQYKDFKILLQNLIESDAQLDLFEFVLQKMVRHHLEPLLNPQFKNQNTTSILTSNWKESANLLVSILARIATQEESVAQKNYWQGIQIIDPKLNNFLSATECLLENLDSTLNQLSVIPPLTKKIILTACAETISADGLIQVEEGELLRAIADILGCAIPPLISSQFTA